MANQRFHVNPAGDAGRCSAKVRCPFQKDGIPDAAAHYPSEERARAAFEYSMEAGAVGFHPGDQFESLANHNEEYWTAMLADNGLANPIYYKGDRGPGGVYKLAKEEGKFMLTHPHLPTIELDPTDHRQLLQDKIIVPSKLPDPVAFEAITKHNATMAHALNSIPGANELLKQPFYINEYMDFESEELKFGRKFKELTSNFQEYGTSLGLTLVPLEERKGLGDSTDPEMEEARTVWAETGQLAHHDSYELALKEATYYYDRGFMSKAEYSATAFALIQVEKAKTSKNLADLRAKTIKLDEDISRVQASKAQAQALGKNTDTFTKKYSAILAEFDSTEMLYRDARERETKLGRHLSEAVNHSYPVF